MQLSIINVYFYKTPEKITVYETLDFAKDQLHLADIPMNKIPRLDMTFKTKHWHAKRTCV